MEGSTAEPGHGNIVVDMPPGHLTQSQRARARTLKSEFKYSDQDGVANSVCGKFIRISGQRPGKCIKVEIRGYDCLLRRWNVLIVEADRSASFSCEEELLLTMLCLNSCIL